MRLILVITALLPSALFGQTFTKMLPLTSPPRKATLLNGSSQYWRTASNATGMDFGTSTDFSIIAVIRHTTSSIGALQRAIGKGISPNPRWSITGGISGQSISVNINDGTNSASVNSTQAINDGFYHLVIATVARAGNVTLYLDGVSTGTPTSMASIGTLTNGSQLDVGSFATSSLWEGTVSECQIIYGKSLTAAEVSTVTSRYKYRGLSRSYSGGTVVAWYDWRSNGVDKSGYGNHLSPTGSPSIISIPR